MEPTSGQSQQTRSSKIPFISSENSGPPQNNECCPHCSEVECSSMPLPSFAGPIEPIPIIVDDSQVIVLLILLFGAPFS